MHRSSVDDWVRFYDEVIVRGGDWAPEAWFEAVEQAMAKALPADSPILDTYRRRVAGLLALDGAEDPSEEDERRIGALEAEIQRLIGAADEVIRTPRTVPARTRRIQDVVDAAEPPRPRRGFLRAAWTTALALTLIGAGLLAALHLYDARLAHMVDQELDRYAGDLEATVTRLQADLEVQGDRSRSEQERLESLREEVAADLETFSREVDGSLARMTTLATDASRDLERRLGDEASDVVEMLDGVAARADALGRDLGEVGGEIRALEKEIPALGTRLSRLAVETDESEASFGETMRRIAALQALAPEIEKMASRERELLDAAVGVEQERLAGLQAEIAALGEELGDTVAELAAARAAVAVELALSEEQRADLEGAVDRIHDTSRMVDEMRRSAEAELTTTQAVLRERTENLLDDLAEKADLAMLRGDDVIGRAERRMGARIAAAGEEAMKVFAEERERELAVLAGRVAETRGELDQARLELIRSWQQMDEQVVARQKAVLDDLDEHARSIEARVADLARTLDLVASARTSTTR